MPKAGRLRRQAGLSATDREEPIGYNRIRDNKELLFPLEIKKVSSNLADLFV